jgi:AraC-like DNA-binding protein
MVMSPADIIDRPADVDPLEDVLALVGARGHATATLVGHGDWALDFPAPDGAKFNAVLRGSCTVDTDGLDEPVTLHAGDAFLLTRPQPFVLATSPTVAPRPASPLFRDQRGADVHAGEPDRPVSARLIGGSVSFDPRAGSLLLDALPPLIHLPADADGAALAAHILARLDSESRHHRLGAAQVVENLAVVLLVDIIRHHVATAPDAVGWLYALRDPVVGAALRAVHADPARAWTVASLAGRANVSRSTLAARFKATVGQGPLEYLTRWRLELAADELARTDRTLATIATHVGYGSEAAFAAAFKRGTGQAPGAYRRRIRAA